MSAFKERRVQEEMEFNYHIMGPRFPLQDIEEDRQESEGEEQS